MFCYTSELTDRHSFRNSMKLRKVEAMFIFLRCSLNYVFIVHFFRLKKKMCTYLGYFCTIFVSFSCRSSAVWIIFFLSFNLFWVMKLQEFKNLSHKVILCNQWTAISSHWGKTVVVRVSGCFWEIMLINDWRSDFVVFRKL